MDLSKYNTKRKRKFGQSQEDEQHLKRKYIKNDKIADWFRRCCTNREHDVTSTKDDNILKESSEKSSVENENINQETSRLIPRQSIRNTNDSNIPVKHLKRSPLLSESRFYQKTSTSYDDSCVACTVQYGSDLWENICENFKYSRKQLYDSKVKV